MTRAEIDRLQVSADVLVYRVSRKRYDQVQVREILARGIDNQGAAYVVFRASDGSLHVAREGDDGVRPAVQ